MIDTVFSSVLTGSMTAETFLLCLLVSVLLGLVIAAVCALGNRLSGESGGSLVLSVAVLPVMIQVVIALVNGNLGAGVAVMGAFSLVRFRSVPGSAREICCIFLAMSVGLATGMGYLGVAVVLTLAVGLISLLLALWPMGDKAVNRLEKELKITIPEELDYTGVFDDLFERYTDRAELMQVKTTNMGSLYRLSYRIRLKKAEEEKAFLDEIRCRNGNLEIVCGRVEQKPQDRL